MIFFLNFTFNNHFSGAWCLFSKLILFFIWKFIFLGWWYCVLLLLFVLYYLVLVFHGFLSLWQVFLHRYVFSISSFCLWENICFHHIKNWCILFTDKWTLSASLCCILPTGCLGISQNLSLLLFSQISFFFKFDMLSCNITNHIPKVVNIFFLF